MLKALEKRLNSVLSGNVLISAARILLYAYVYMHKRVRYSTKLNDKLCDCVSLFIVPTQNAPNPLIFPYDSIFDSKDCAPLCA